MQVVGWDVVTVWGYAHAPSIQMALRRIVIGTASNCMLTDSVIMRNKGRTS